VLRASYRWRVPDPIPVTEASFAAARSLGLSERQLRLLIGRGVETAELAGFVGRPEEGLHDPGLLPDAGSLVERVARARAHDERVLVFGDFDADGLTGLAVLTEALRAVGLEVDIHVPSRVADGHGLSRRAVEDAAARGCRLIFTVDCGTASLDEIRFAAERGIDVIVTDHHHVPPALPPAVAIVNPQRSDSRYPDGRLAGAGVAFKVAQLLLATFGGADGAGDGGPATAQAALALSELAAIGTVADVAPLVGENRSIVRLGLERLRTRPRPGLAALLARAGVPAAEVDVESLGYVVAPRLNAAGRLGDAMVAARLLLTHDDAEAALLAAQLHATNVERRVLLGAALDEVRGALAERGEPGDQPIVMAAGPWSPGIIGLVAGRLAEEHRRPAVIVSTDVSPWRASARSVGGWDLAAAFEACADLLERHGGHRDAAGCTLTAEHWEGFRLRLGELAGAAPLPEPVDTLFVDLVLPAAEVDYRLLRELAMLEPTGPGNPPPLIAITGLEVLRARAVNGGHSQVTLRKGLEVLDGIAFDQPDLAPALAAGDRLDVVARLASRTFGGFESLQLEIRDAALSGSTEWAGGELASLVVAPGPAA
jgi:single-stranded-DNA-specific exonuclease